MQMININSFYYSLPYADMPGPVINYRHHTRRYISIAKLKLPFDRFCAAPDLDDHDPIPRDRLSIHCLYARRY